MRIQFTQRRCVGKEAAFTVRDRNAQDGPDRHASRKRGIGNFYAQIHHLADEVKRAIANQRPGKQTGLAQNLKTVAGADHELARTRFLQNRAA